MTIVLFGKQTNCSGHTLNDDCLVMTILICLPLPLFSSPLYYITSHSQTKHLFTPGSIAWPIKGVVEYLARLG